MLVAGAEVDLDAAGAQQVLTKYIPTSDDRRFWFYDYVLGHTHVHVPCV